MITRFGQDSDQVTCSEIQHLRHVNTNKSRATIWKQFTDFFSEMFYEFDEENVPLEELALILTDQGFNKRKIEFRDK